MKLLNFNIIKLTICLIIGICIGFYAEISLYIFLILFGIVFSCFSLIYFIGKWKNRASSLFGITALFLFVLFGILRIQLYDETLKSSHYINSEIDYTDHQNFNLKLIKRLKPDNYNDKFFAEIQSLNASTTSGKILINLKKDSTKTQFNIDDVFFVNTKLAKVVEPKNPFQFNYNAYLKQRNILHQIYANYNDLLPLESSSNTIYGYADAFRNKVNSKLEKESFSAETLSIINALLLGQRQGISTETYTNYVNAGTIHILAVSGLHVGIIYWILSLLFKPLNRIRYGKHFITPILIILLLWGFAFIAGLSPSVTRAVTMFSIVACANFLRRPRNIFNTLVISAFVLLLVKPIYLFDVGFQMSYLAVLAIVTIQPLIYKLWQPKYKAVNFIWQIFTVTLAAQLGVAPLGLFYFHQFPGLFFLSNLVIIPFLGLILGFGILVIALSLFDSLPLFLSKTFNYIIESLNSFIAWVAQFESFLLRDVSFSIYHVLASYILIISIIYLWKTRSYRALQYSLCSVLFFSFVMVYTKHQNHFSELVIYNKTRATLISEKRNTSLKIYHNLDSTALLNTTALKNYKVGSFIKKVEVDSLKNVIAFNKKLILVIDSLSVYNTSSFKADYVLLKDSPQINLNRLIDSVKPQKIIADASNYKSYVERWKATCADKKIPFHSTYEKGAFIIK